jgi:CheY-like chemotaxis protein
MDRRLFSHPSLSNTAHKPGFTVRASWASKAQRQTKHDDAIVMSLSTKERIVLPLPVTALGSGDREPAAPAYEAKGNTGVKIQSPINSGSSRPYIFIVEDEPFIASMLEDMVRELGYQCSGIAYRLANALARLSELDFRVDAALVDIKLREELAYKLCHALSDRGIPFAFASALGPNEIEAPWRKCHNIGKPFSMDSVAQALEHLLGDAEIASREHTGGSNAELTYPSP